MKYMSTARDPERTLSAVRGALGTDPPVLLITPRSLAISPGEMSARPVSVPPRTEPAPGTLVSGPVVSSRLTIIRSRLIEAGYSEEAAPLRKTPRQLLGHPV